MRRILIAYALTALCFLALDAVWLSTSMGWLYAPRIGPLLLAQPKLLPALLFYALYLVGVVAFAVAPALPERGLMARPGLALRAGVLLGLVAYGTYDLTNMATLQGWSAAVCVADMLWGMFATGLAALGGTLATAKLLGAPR